jgi:ferredoxin
MRATGSRWILGRAGIDDLIGALRDDGYEVIGPVAKGGAIAHGPVTRATDLPIGWTERQEPGTYRLVPRDDEAVFGFAVGPDSYKEHFFRSEAPLVQLRRNANSVAVASLPSPPRKVALLGARACEIAAIATQDRILLEGAYVDEDYAARRRDAFVVALQCSTPGGTCFCVSMKTGPKASGGFDLALTELLEDSHRFVVEIGTERGARLAERLPLDPATARDVERADAVVAATASRMGRHLDTRGIKDLLYENLEHPRWDEVASRCLACTNCTLVCPTCFCADRVETTTLDGSQSEQTRRLDSCFSLEHSHVHGGPVRGSVRARYRQWLTHKLASWIDQFGSSGCVGCGRCITWCPVGIDITEEVAAIQADDLRRPRS